MDEAELRRASAKDAIEKLMEHRDRASWRKIGECFPAIEAEATRRAGTDKGAAYRREYKALIDQAPNLVELMRMDPEACRHAVWMHANWEMLERWLEGLGPDGEWINHPTDFWEEWHRRGGAGARA